MCMKAARATISRHALSAAKCIYKGCISTLSVHAVQSIITTQKNGCTEAQEKGGLTMIEAISYAIFYVSLFAFLIYALLRL